MAELMTLPELAEYLRFTRKTIYGLLKQGEIPAVRIGRKWRFDKQAIDGWLRNNMKKFRARILVIDDEPVIGSFLRILLEEQGYTVVTTTSGVEGIEHIKQGDFDLVFLDLKLPDISGAEVFRRLKDIKPALTVIIITGYPDSDLMERALGYGPFGVVKKPFIESDITNIVNSFLKVAR